MKKIGYIIIFTVCTLLCLSTSRTRADSPLIVIDCPNITTFTPNSTYKINLNTLLSSLHDNASFSPTGFFSSSVGTSDVVYGIFLCRGDVSTDDCSNCVQSATEEVLDMCPKSKEATMWYDHCMIRYSNNQFLGNFYSGGYVYLWANIQPNVSDPEGRFEHVLSNTLNDTATRAAVGDGSGKKYAVGEGLYFLESIFSASQTVYVLAQCTPDLSEYRCENCLATCTAELSASSRRVRSSGSATVEGAGILYPSCNVRFHPYQFYNTRAVGPPPPSSSLSPPPPPPAKGKEKKASKVLVVVVVAIGAAVLLFNLGFCLLTQRKSIRKKNNSVGLINQGGNDINTERSLQYDLSTIQAATNNFSLENKIGEGGYGSVYKGVLANGIEVAVKRLSQNSGQGATEFKNEVIVVEKLQHRNLVKLLGFCLQGEEKILIYEFVPNKSLDYFLFDPQKSRTLDWSRRFKIIAGIARGMLYLHEDSRLRIIHRDLKAANILLDWDMAAKVADFGMARIFGRDQTHGNTSRVVGTLGYMSPEYFLGHFSVKSDVFSFGVLILEIISGVRSNSNFHLSDCSNLEGYAWKLWEEGRPLDLVDDVLQGSYSESEVRRCTHIGLLCVQDDPDARPSMATAVLMLNSHSVSLPVPLKPAFVDPNQAGPTLPNMADRSTSQLIPPSVNEASITDLYPR